MTNVTLFHERALPRIVVGAPPPKLSNELAEVRQAATHLGIEI